MPTKITAMYDRIYSEVADRDWHLEEEGTNRFGLTSRTPKPADGRWGYTLEGVRVPSTLRVAHLTNSNVDNPNGVMGIVTRELAFSDEGHHYTNAVMVWKDIGPSHGQTIVSASLTLYRSDGTIVATAADSGQNKFPYKARLFAVNDVYCPRWIEQPWGYSSTDKAEHWPQFAYPRRYRATSYDWHQRHTIACARWTLTDIYETAPWAVPTRATPVPCPTATDVGPYMLEDIIQEVIDNPKWKPDSKLCLILGPSGNLANEGSPRGLGSGPYGYNPDSTAPPNELIGDQRLFCTNYRVANLSITYS